MNVVLLANDLMVVSRLQSATTQLGAQLLSAANAIEAVELCENESAGLLVVDLATAGLELGFVQQLKTGAAQNIRIVAFGPHVHKERLAAARDAGCDLVLSRGQFFNDVEAIVKSAAN